MKDNIAQNKRRFIQLALDNDVLRFGEFTLKSGRVSPYFFNAGLFNTGGALAELAACYAQVIVDQQLEFEVLFGPAYKGIPLAAAIAVTLATRHGVDKPYAFNRKEAKDHGEGGNIVGAPVEGRVLVVDDVITAGTAIREAVDIIAAAGGKTSSILIALDRQERGQGQLTAIQEVQRDFALSVHNIISMDDLITYIQADERYNRYLDAMRAYRDRYGV